MVTLAQRTMNQFNQAGDMAGASANLGFSALNDAFGGYGFAGSMMPFDIRARQLSGTDLSPYMNPFTKNVIDTTMGELNRQETIQNNNIQDTAQRVGAFGGDRMAIQQAENNRNFDQQRASTIANLNQANFGNAQQMGLTDINNTLNADVANQGMRSGMAQFGIGGLGGLGNALTQFGQSQLGNLSQQGFNMGQNLEQRNLQMGTAQQQQSQQILDAIKAATQGWSGYGDTGLARYFGATQNPQGYGTQTTQTNPGIMGILGGIGSVLGPFLSDRRLKKNIKKIGTFKYGNIYEYNYLWEADNVPKTLGVMAQEMLITLPKAVLIHPLGVLMVNYKMLGV